MSKVMGWVKSNLVIVILCAAAVIILPVCWVASSMWNASIREKQQAAASKDMTALNGAGVSYTIPSALPGQQEVRIPWSAPNDSITRFVKEQREKQSAQVRAVVDEAQGLNSRGHGVLIEGLFPSPANESDAKIKTLEFAEALVGRSGKPSAYAPLLAAVNAGEPVDPVRLAEQVADIVAREAERRRQEKGQDKMEPEEEKELAKRLSQFRVGEYQRRAGEISVYAGLDVMPLPKMSLDVAPEVWRCFTWQWDYWVAQDILAAVKAANTAGGRMQSVDQGVVKRLERMDIEPLPIYENPLSREPDGAEGGSRAPLDFAVSVTGRHSSKANKLYDVRPVKLTMVVSSSRLPELLSAFSSTDFMTVIGLDVDGVNIWADLEKGYYYGQEHVVRVDLRVETIWLRSWTVPLMPREIRSKLAVPEPKPAESAPAPEGGK